MTITPGLSSEAMVAAALATPWRRFRIWANMLFVDHGFIRFGLHGRIRLDDRMMRSSQVLPHQVAWARRQGIRTIINLRGRRDDCGSYILEDDACRRHGVKLVNFPVNSRAAPKLEYLRGARELFRRVEYPVLMHCKAGADRAGLMSVLYLFAHKGVPLDRAMAELSLRRGHLKHGRTGIIDAFFEQYAADNAKAPIAFWDWVDTVYDPDALKASFRPRPISSALVDWVLRRE